MIEYMLYVLKARSGKTYVGQTIDPDERVLRHNRHSSKATRSEEEWRIVHKESFPSRSMAVKRERFLKSGDGRRVLKNKGI